MPAPQIQSKLTGVPETMLWTLHNRAQEAVRTDSILHDPWCVEIYKSIDYDFEKHFGKPDASHAVRSKLFDEPVKAFLKRHPEGLVIALGEGLETQALRCDNGRNRWLSIDLPEAIAIRGKCLPAHPRRTSLALSALDEAWLRSVENEPVCIVAQGLFMYFLTRIELLKYEFPRGFMKVFATVFATLPFFKNKVPCAVFCAKI